MTRHHLPGTLFSADHIEIPMVVPTVMPITIPSILPMPVVIPVIVPQMTSVAITTATFTTRRTAPEPTIRDVTPPRTAALRKLREPE